MLSSSMLYVGGGYSPFFRDSWWDLKGGTQDGIRMERIKKVSRDRKILLNEGN